MELRLELAYHKPQEVIRLFTEYTDASISKDPEVAKCLESQHYEDEVRGLKEKYGLPHGRLYLAYWGEEVAGCVALRPLDGDCCEMKRLYVRPGYQGKHMGKALSACISGMGLLKLKPITTIRLPRLFSWNWIYKRNKRTGFDKSISTLFS